MPGPLKSRVTPQPIAPREPSVAERLSQVRSSVIKSWGDAMAGIRGDELNAMQDDLEREAVGPRYNRHGRHQFRERVTADGDLVREVRHPRTGRWVAAVFDATTGRYGRVR